MDQNFEVADSSDWIDTPFAPLGPVESALRCQVCKDFYDTPMITSCSHTFCSLCIRRCLSNDGKCPACRAADQELKLRKNGVVQELVDAFRSARPSILGLGEEVENVRRKGNEWHSLKRKLEGADVEEREDPSARRRITRSQSQRLSRTPPSETTQSSGRLSGNVTGLTIERSSAACPICGQKMKEEDVFLHLDTHSDGNESLQPPGTISSKPRVSYHNFPKCISRSTTRKPQDRLPNLNYSILKEGALRKKLSDLGIPIWGPKTLLVRRHTEWVNLWNANCDSLCPRTKRELLRDLDTWERTQGGIAAATPGATHGFSNVMSKDFDSVAWASSHDDSFRQLIAKARGKQNRPCRASKDTINDGAVEVNPHFNSSRKTQESDLSVKSVDQSSFAESAVVEPEFVPSGSPEMGLDQRNR